jgi:hypothetical protein
MYRKVLTFVLLASLVATAQRPSHRHRSAGPLPRNWDRLKSWAGEYPISEKGNIFNDPEVHRALFDLLGHKNYQRLLKDFAQAEVIDVTQNYLVLQGVTTDATLRAVVALRLDDASAHVGFYSNGEFEVHGAIPNPRHVPPLLGPVPPLQFCLPDPIAEARPAGPHPHNLQRLKRWAGEYPLSNTGDVFDDPEVRQALLDVLGNADYGRLLEDFGVEVQNPISMIRGYLFFQGSPDDSIGRSELAYVAIRLIDGKAHVAFYSNQEFELYPMTVDNGLPRCLVEEIAGGGDGFNSLLSMLPLSLDHARTLRKLNKRFFTDSRE